MELTQAQLERFHERLFLAKEIAEHVLAESKAGVRGVEASGGTIGRLTRMDAIQVQSMSKLSRSQLDVRLQQINAALRAWDSGHYGRCNRCKGQISFMRLDALPEAPLCLRCQEQLERS